MVDIHEASYLETAKGMVELGLLKGTPEGLIEQGVIELFYPHGLAHMVGLGVRDATGKFPGRAPRTEAGKRLQRMDLPLEPGYVVTIEPGIYFIPPLLRDPKRREKFADQVVWSKVDPWMAQGGIRIEDTVHVTTGAPENMTAAIPK